MGQKISQFLKIGITVGLLGLTNSAFAKLTIYTYDSFTSPGSLGAWLKTHYSKESLELVAFGSAGEALNQLLIEGERTQADLLIGVDTSLLEKAKKISFTQLRPFNFGYLAFVYDEKKTQIQSPVSFFDFIKDPRWKKKIILEDPRTSSVGFSFLAATYAYSDGKPEAVWKTLSRQVLTTSPSWSAAYGMFLKGEGSFVLSYTTSPAYHRKEDPQSSVRALLFREGHFRQEEFVGVLKGSKNQAAANAFVDFLLSEKAQSQVPELNWMFPVASVGLPASFQVVPTSLKTLSYPVEKVNRETWIRQWRQWMVP